MLKSSSLSGMTNGFLACFTALPILSTYAVMALASRSAKTSSVMMLVIFSNNSVPSSSVMTSPAFVSSCWVGSSFLMVCTASAISSKLHPEAWGLYSSSGSSSEYPSSSGVRLLNVSSSFSVGTDEGESGEPNFVRAIPNDEEEALKATWAD